MKKILYIDVGLNGHREKYLRELIKMNEKNNYQIYTLLPNTMKDVDVVQYEMKSGYNAKRNIITYIKFIKEIKKIAYENNIDVIHFLCGDSLYRFFGLKLRQLKSKVIITYHHMILKGLKKISIRRLFKKSDCGIVHTQELYNKLQENKIYNSYLVDYPMLDFVSIKDVISVKKQFGLPLNMPIIGVIGGTSEYKGLDFLIKALNNVRYECCLFVAGRVITFDKEYIEGALKNKKVKLVLALKELTDEEFADAVQASDIIALPYRLEFDGASGILIESLFHNKHVIGSSHGSMGSIIKKYHLGRTFETNSLEDLIDKLEEDILNPYVLSSEAQAYKDKLSPQRFLETHDILYDECLKNI